ncbi:MAG: acyloxyacyl hydrolase [Bacteroidota bacterium]
MRISLLAFLCALALHVFSQTDTINPGHKSYRSISANYQYGSILPTTDFVKGDNLMGKPMTKYQAYTLKMLWQNPGYTSWQKVFHAPYYGAGITIGNFYNPLEVGYPVSLYGILGLPIKRWKKLELYSEFQFGFAGNWKHYDPVNNTKNLVIGGSMTVHLNLGISAFYPLTKHMDLGAGLSFIHFSNGGFERPNNGFNIYSPSIELKYHLLSDRPDLSTVKIPGRLDRSNDLFIMLGYGDYQLSQHELDTNYFAFGGISAIYFTQLSNAFRLGYGADANYCWGLTALPDGTMGPQSAKNLTLGFILQPEIIIDKLTLVGGIGIYAIHPDYGSFNQTYQRLGVRYEIYKNLSLGVNIRAINFMLAEFLEFNLGYRIRWVK